MPGHDHGGRSVDAGEPGSLGIGHAAVLVGERVLAEVPDRSVVGLGVVVDGDSKMPPVEIGNELGFARLYVLPVPADGSRLVEQGGFGPPPLAVEPGRSGRPSAGC